MSIGGNAANAKGIAKRIEDCRLAGGKGLDLYQLYMTELPAETNQVLESNSWCLRK